ncbi:hypothetical protein JZU56_04560, partial [bacterium]|nr:hypothetical protein [bacterium]
ERLGKSGIGLAGILAGILPRIDLPHRSVPDRAIQFGLDTFCLLRYAAKLLGKQRRMARYRRQNPMVEMSEQRLVVTLEGKLDGDQAKPQPTRP